MATQQEIETINATPVLPSSTDVREAAERVTALANEVIRMRELLRAVNNGEPVSIPPDIAQYYGRIQQGETEIRQAEERFGRDVLQMAMADDGPQNKEAPQSAAEVLDAGSLVEFARTQHFEFQSETTKTVQFDVMLPSEEMLTLTLARPEYSSPIQSAHLSLEGVNKSQVISAPEGIQLLSREAKREWADNTVEFSMDLAGKAAEVEDLAQMFAEFVAAPGISFGVAEKLLAAHIEEQLRAGMDHVNLTQSYLTDDPKEADARHTLALHNLLPLIETAQRNGISFDSGEAISAGQKFKEVIAVRPTNREEENRFSVTG
jgi:hypothetical protein